MRKEFCQVKSIAAAHMTFFKIDFPTIGMTLYRVGPLMAQVHRKTDEKLRFSIRRDGVWLRLGRRALAIYRATTRD